MGGLAQGRNLDFLKDSLSINCLPTGTIVSPSSEHFLSVSGVERIAPPPHIPWSEIFAGDYTSRPNTVKHYFLQCKTISIVSLEL